MSDRKRIIITIISVSFGSFLSYLLYKFRRGGGPLNSQDVFSLGTNMVFALGIILGVGFLFLWKKNDKLK
jgi:hypothetical protein